MKKLLVYGAGGHAKVVAEAARLSGWQIAGFLDGVDPHRKNTEFYGSRILGGEEVLEGLMAEGVKDSIIAFGHNEARLNAAAVLEKHGFRMATIIHSHAVCSSDASIGEGSLVCAGAVVSTSATIGRNVIVNTRATIDHDCVIGDGVHICPGAVLCGSVRVGEGAWVGAGATVIERKQIGSYSVIGAGGVVVSDIPERVLAIGLPARISREVHGS